jgi:hypothetical protein
MPSVLIIIIDDESALIIIMDDESVLIIIIDDESALIIIMDGESALMRIMDEESVLMISMDDESVLMISMDDEGLHADQPAGAGPAAITRRHARRLGYSRHGPGRRSERAPLAEPTAARASPVDSRGHLSGVRRGVTYQGCAEGSLIRDAPRGHLSGISERLGCGGGLISDGSTAPGACGPARRRRADLGVELERIEFELQRSRGCGAAGRRPPQTSPTYPPQPTQGAPNSSFREVEAAGQLVDGLLKPRRHIRLSRRRKPLWEP